VADPLDRLEIHLAALVLVARIRRPRREADPDRGVAQRAQVVDPRRTPAAGIVDEHRVGLPVAHLARHRACALHAVEVAELQRRKGNEPLAREDHRGIVAEPRHVDAQHARGIGIVLRPVVPLDRLGAFVGADQGVERARRELAEHVDQHPGIVAAVFLDLVARPILLHARRALWVVGIGGDLDHVPQPALRGAGAIERPFEMRGIAGLDDVALDAGRQGRFRRGHHGIGDAA
jgi:hypothetical protein